MSSVGDDADVLRGRPITFLIHSLSGGGAEFVTRVWATTLAARGHDVRVLMTNPGDAEPQLTGVRQSRLGGQGSGRRGQIVALRRLLASAPDQVVISMMTRSNIVLLSAVATLRSGRRPVSVISERNMPYVERSHSVPHRAFRRSAVRLLYPIADQFVAISHPVGAVFTGLAALERTRVAVVPNPALGKAGVLTGAGVDTGRAGGPLSIVVPARLVAKKRPLLAVEVADVLAAQGHDVRLIFFGDGDMRPELEGLSRAYPIELRGWVDAWYDELPGGAVVLLTSAVEGFANVLVEAASRGAPSVAPSTAMGCADAIVPGVTGVLTLGDEARDLAAGVLQAAAITPAIDSPWLARFTAEASTAVLEQALGDAVRHRRRLDQRQT
ncbi:glycosyltransferase [uncultured Jatrophihabitans sp.]|uniref:glycosyltransferase n=1 Tax=uncultured Jatrophihabitans sp. TaxID=1610747 RepID=UPI0035CB6E81